MGAELPSVALSRARAATRRIHIGLPARRPAMWASTRRIPRSTARLGVASSLEILTGQPSVSQWMLGRIGMMEKSVELPSQAGRQHLGLASGLPLPSLRHERDEACG